ncbi:MAG: F0F1 ATP synthase subunit delta [Candidatus Ratteibacteria bacterium]|nr:F0F1 ATP synthase subunit delta [Candidatus Ratteibacteria bacterium]
MFIAKLLIIQGVVFVGLLFFLRYVLTHSVTTATTHLEELSKDYTKKQEEAKKQLEEAKKESSKIVADAQLEAIKHKNETSHEAQKEKDRIIQEAQQKSEQMIKQAEKTCEQLKQEINERIDAGATEKAAELIEKAIPKEFREGLHHLWFKEFLKSDLQIERLHLSKDIKNVEITSAFPLTEEQRKELKNKLAKKLSESIVLKEKVDAVLIAGIIITLGSVVIDGSLKYKIQQEAK